MLGDLYKCLELFGELFVAIVGLVLALAGIRDFLGRFAGELFCCSPGTKSA
jgi:hypothetical protein